MTPLPPDNPPHGFVLWMVLGAAILWIADLLLHRAGTPHPLDDTWEYGLVARSLLEGHGFRTAMIHPPLWGLRDSALTVPLLVHGPLLPLLGAPLLAALGPAALDQAAWLAAAFATGAAVFTARAVARALGSAAGIAAAILVAASPVMLRMVHHDIAPAAGACFVALVLDLVTRREPRAFAAGIAAGAGALVRPELLLAAPCAAWALGSRRLAPFMLGLLLVVTPWAWHTFAAVGSPVFSLSSYLLIAYTRTHPGLSPLWDFGIPPSRWNAALAASLPELPAKWAHFAPRAIKHLLMAPAPGFGLVSALGAAAAWRAPETRRIAGAALCAALIPFVLCTTTESSERYVAVFLPLWAAGAVRGAAALAGGTVRARFAQAALVVVLLPFTLRTMVAESRQSAALHGWLVAERTALASRGALALRGRLLFSDTPDLAAWSTGRPTLATTLEQYRTLSSPSGTDASRPPRGGPLDEWFHADLRSTPAPTHGGSAEEVIAGAGGRMPAL